jgi:hypothetical protein
MFWPQALCKIIGIPLAILETTGKPLATNEKTPAISLVDYWHVKVTEGRRLVTTGV